MSYSFASSVTDNKVSEIAESRIPVDPPVPFARIYTATSRLVSLIPPSCRIAGRNIPVHRRKADTMEPPYAIGSLIFETPLYFLFCMQPECIFQGSILQGTSSRTKLLLKSCLPTNSYTSSTSTVFVLLTAVVFETPLSLIDKVSIRYRLHILATTLVSHTLFKFIYWAS